MVDHPVSAGLAGLVLGSFRGARGGQKNGRFRDRCGQGLFIDAGKMGRMVDRADCEIGETGGGACALSPEGTE